MPGQLGSGEIDPVVWVADSQLLGLAPQPPHPATPPTPPPGSEGDELALWPLLMRTPIQFLRAPPSWSTTSLRSHLQIPILQGLDFNTGIWGRGHKHSGYNNHTSPVASPSFHLEVTQRTFVRISLDEASPVVTPAVEGSGELPSYGLPADRASEPSGEQHLSTWPLRMASPLLHRQLRRSGNPIPQTPGAEVCQQVFATLNCSLLTDSPKLS